MKTFPNISLNSSFFNFSHFTMNSEKKPCPIFNTMLGKLNYMCKFIV